VVFTGRPLQEILDPDVGGSGDWRLDIPRAQAAEFLVCTRNRHSPDFAPTPEAHHAAFLIGRKQDIVPSPTRGDRWLIRISDYIECLIPNIWGKSGQLHLRYPVWYTTLEDLGIDLAALPPFRPIPRLRHGSELAEAAGFMLRPTPPGMPLPGRPHPIRGRDAEARFDAILAQLDRIPDLPAAADPLEWDEHGLPR
jgi:antitoxin VapB